MNTEVTQMELDKISASDFQPFLNQPFTFIISSETSLEAELIEVLVLKGYSPLERGSFSITFRTQQQHEYYQQGTFRVKHEVLAGLEIFLSPKGFDGTGMRYEAVFS